MDKERKLTPEEQKELDKAKATLARLEPTPAVVPPVLRRFRVNLEGVTVDTRRENGKTVVVHRDNTCRAMVRDEKTGRGKEVTIDRAVVEAFNEADAWQKFCKAWGIRNSDHTPTFAEVRDLTEDERIAPPPNVVPPRPDALTGVPAPIVLPVRADPILAPSPGPTIAG